MGISATVEDQTAVAQRATLSTLSDMGEELVSIHRSSLRIAAEFSVRGWADGPTATSVTGSAALLQSQKLLGTEGLVVNLAGGLNEILEVGASQEIAQVYKLAVVLVLNVDDTPAVLAATNLLAVDDNGLLTTDNREGDDVLNCK